MGASIPPLKGTPSNYADIEVGVFEKDQQKRILAQIQCF